MLTTGYPSLAALNTSASLLSFTAGPFLGANSYSWSQIITPTIVGTVYVTVDQIHNSTHSATIYHTDYEVNGTQTLLTRTNTNAAGTVTGSVIQADGQRVTVAYPTPVFIPSPSFTWAAVLPITQAGSYAEIIPTTIGDGTSVLPSATTFIVSDVGSEGACCLSSWLSIATPTHSPFPSDAPTDTADPRGWLYSLVGWNDFDESTLLASGAVSSLWAPQTLDLGSMYAGCAHTYCKGSRVVTSVEPAQVLSTQAALLVTTTTTISASSSSSTTPSAGSGDQSSSVSASRSSTTTTASSPHPQVSAQDAPSSSTQSSSSSSTEVGAAPARTRTTTTARTAKPSQPLESASAPAPAASSASTITTSNPVIVVGSSSVARHLSSEFVVGGQTVRLGSTITLGSGSSTTEVAIRTSGSETIIEVGRLTSTLSDVPTAITTPVPLLSTQEVVVGGVTIRPAVSSSTPVVGLQTLTPGLSITLGSGSSTTIVALRTSGSQTILQVGTIETTLTDQPTATVAPVSIGGVTISEPSPGVVVVDGETLTLDSSITLGSGSSTTVVALETSGSATIVQVGTSRATLTAAPGAMTTHIGGYVISGLGGGGNTPAPTGRNSTFGGLAPTDTGNGITPSNGASGRCVSFTFWSLTSLAAAVAAL